MPENEGPPSRQNPTVVLPPGKGESHEHAIEACKRAIRRGALDHIAYFIHGNLRFSVDILDSEEAEELAALSGARTDRDDLARYGRQLNLIISRLDDAVESVPNGRIIRTVFDVEAATLFYFFVTKGVYLVGTALSPGKKSEADEHMAELVDEIRRIKGFGGAGDPGGYQQRYNPRSHEELRLSGYTEIRDKTGEPGELIEACSDAVDPENVHYLGFFREAELAFSVDVFKHPALSDFFENIEREERRDRYEKFGRLLYLITGRLERSLFALLGGKLFRTVVDVEAGAIFYLQIREGEYIIGVCLDQSQVAVADRLLVELSLGLRENGRY